MTSFGAHGARSDSSIGTAFGPRRGARRHAAGRGLTVAALLGAAAAGAGCAGSSSTASAQPGAAAAPAEIVDLTHPFDAETIYWPTETEGFVHEPGSAGRGPDGWYEAHRFRAPEHGGTHLDAPVHFAEGRHPVEAIELDRLVAPGVVVDVSAACAADPDHAVSVADLEAFERAHGRIPDGAIVLLRTGFGRHWPDRARYLGTSATGPAAVAAQRFPGLSGEAARWLAEERRIGAVGIDTASIDPGRSRRFEAHRELSERQVPALENVAQLERLPLAGFQVVALPMKIRGGSGAPLRVIAILPAAARRSDAVPDPGR